MRYNRVEKSTGLRSMGMDDLQSILASHHSRDPSEGQKKDFKIPEPSISEIPDVFFDFILVHYKLNRIEIMLMMFLYRKVWCQPNLYQKFGISPMLSHTEMGKVLGVTLDEIYSALRKLESFNFIETIRSGQYFVRRFFTEDLDQTYSQVYDDF